MPGDKQALRTHLNGGHFDAISAYGLKPNQLANGKNWRTVNGECRTAKGYITSTSSVIHGGVTSVRGLNWAVRSDGTEDLIGVADRGIWRIVGDTKTLISLIPEQGLVTTVSGTVVSGDADANFEADAAIGDAFWMDVDGVAASALVAARPAPNIMLLSTSYGGATTAGAFTIWARGTDAPSRAVFWNDKWFFSNGTDELSEWDGTTYRWSRVDEWANQPNSVTIATAAAGGMASATYFYRFCLEDSDGNFGNAGPRVPLSATLTEEGSLVITPTSAFYDMGGSERRMYSWISHIRLYETTGAATNPYSYVTSIAVATTAAFTRDGTIDADITDALPISNTPLAGGAEDLIVFDNRLCAISGRRLYISGLPPTDSHTLAAGRLEPYYWTVVHRVGDGEETGELVPAVLKGNLFLFGSKHIWRVDRNSDDPQSWGIYVFGAGVGCMSRASLGRVGEWVYFLGREQGRLAVIRFNGRNYENIGLGVDAILNGIDTAKYSEAVGGVAHGFYWLTIPAGTYKTAEFNIRDRTWGWRDWQMQAFADTTDEAHMALNNGIIYKPENGYNKDAAAQEYSMDTAAWDLGVPEWPKRFQSAQVEFDVYAGAPVVSAQQIVDQGAAASLPSVTFSATTANRIYREHLSRSAYGQRMQLRFIINQTGVDAGIRTVAVKGEIESQDAD